jgi:biopolymer transport protein TolR
MPALSSRGGGRRRTINEINMVPFIDVMLVLLIIFMVSAPLITTGVVDVPSVGKAKQQPEHVIEVTIGADESLRLRMDGKDSGRPSLKEVAVQVKALQGNDPNVNTPVIIAAEKTVKYEVVVKVMDMLQRAGVSRVGLSVKTTGG